VQYVDFGDQSISEFMLVCRGSGWNWAAWFPITPFALAFQDSEVAMSRAYPDLGSLYKPRRPSGPPGPGIPGVTRPMWS